MAEWRPVVGFEDFYEVSEFGDVRTVRKRGAIPAGYVVHPQRHSYGYREFNLYAYGRSRRARAHRLVAAAFIGPIEGLVVRHKDDDPANNHYSNLELGTQQQNIADAVSRGRNSCGNAKKTHCKNGHEFNESNTHIAPDGSRVCRPCSRAYLQAYRAAKKSKETD